MHRATRRDVMAGLGAVGIGGVAGCLEDVPGLGSRDIDAANSGTNRTIEHGLLLPLSGDLRDLGRPVRDAAKLPFTELEGEGVPFEFDYQVKDTGTKPSTGVQGAIELVDAGVPSVTGAVSSGVSLEVTKKVLIPYRKATCSPASTSPTITALNDRGTVFRTIVSDTLQGVVLAERAATDLGVSSAATMYTNNDYGWQLSRSFARSFQAEHGGEVTAQVPFEQAPEGEEDVSYRSELEDARADDPELLVIIGYPQSGAHIFADFFETGGEEEVLVTDPLRHEGLVESVDHSLAGIRGTAPLSGGPGREAFEEMFFEEYDRDTDDGPGPYTAHAYDATAVLLLANAYAGANDGEAITNAVRQVANPDGEVVVPGDLATGMELAAEGTNVEYRGASSAVSFDANGDMVDAEFEYWEFTDDGIERIDTVSL